MKSLTRKFLSFLILSGFVACATTPPPKPYAPSYKYEMKVKPDDPKSDAVVAVVSPEFCTAKLRKDPTIGKFCAAIDSSIAEVLTSKGMKVLGPFEDIGAMVYQDKQTAHLVILPRFNVAITAEIQAVGSPKPVLMCDSCEPNQEYQVSLATGGSVVLAVLEPLSRQELWQKKIDLDDDAKTYKITDKPRKYKDGPVKPDLWDTADRNFFATSLEKQYLTIMEKLDGYLSGGEMEGVKKQAIEIKAKTGFTGK